jgi:SAM-dependent methyltransferase
MLKANANGDGSFLDIGSGFGKMVFMVAWYSNSNAYGIEVVPYRHDMSVKFLERLRDDHKDYDDIMNMTSRVHFIKGNTNDYERFQFNGKDFTYIYSANWIFHPDDVGNVL